VLLRQRKDNVAFGHRKRVTFCVCSSRNAKQRIVLFGKYLARPSLQGGQATLLIGGFRRLVYAACRCGMGTAQPMGLFDFG